MDLSYISFVDPSRENVYILPEEKSLRDPLAIETHQQSSDEEEEEDGPEKNIPEPERDGLLEDVYRLEKEDAGSDEEVGSNGDNAAYKEDRDLDKADEQNDEKRSKQREAKKKMAVQKGKVHKESQRSIKKQEIE